MSLRQSQLEPTPSGTLPAGRPSAGAWRALLARGSALLEEAGREAWQRARRQHPLVSYRLIALVIAILIASSSLNLQTSLTSEAWALLLAAVHVGATLAIVPRLEARSDAANIIAMAIDIAVCVSLLALTDGWRGPLWLFSLSAVFWPAFRFALRGALASVVVFEAGVLLTNAGRVRSSIDRGFGGDLVARLLMVFIIAGAISLTSELLHRVRRLAAENERNRIARDLHDGVGKTLGGISMEARWLVQWIERDPEEARRRARYVARISEKAAIEVRDVIRQLRQTEASTWLFPSVRAIVEDWGQIHSATVHLQLNGQDAEVPVLIHGEVVRMLGELLTNVERYAGATRVWVRVTLSSSGVTLAVRDNGVGFDVHALDPWADEGHFGLLGARERASMLGGWFRVVSSQGSGTEVTIDLPLAAREERAIPILWQEGRGV